MIEVRALAIPEIKLITPERFLDARGYFSETYSKNALAEAGLVAEFVQDNHSFSALPGVVRGLHFQIPPLAQAKLIRVARGAIFDVAVDIRRGSPSYGMHVSAVLSADNWAQLWIPVGFAHGFCTLEPETDVLYKTTDYYAPNLARGISWNDPLLAIDWPDSAKNAILSEADRNNPSFAEFASAFDYSKA